MSNDPFGSANNDGDKPSSHHKPCNSRGMASNVRSHHSDDEMVRDQSGSLNHYGDRLSLHHKPDSNYRAGYR